MYIHIQARDHIYRKRGSKNSARRRAFELLKQQAVDRVAGYLRAGTAPAPFFSVHTTEHPAAHVFAAPRVWEIQCVLNRGKHWAITIVNFGMHLPPYDPDFRSMEGNLFERPKVRDTWQARWQGKSLVIEPHLPRPGDAVQNRSTGIQPMLRAHERSAEPAELCNAIHGHYFTTVREGCGGVLFEPTPKHPHPFLFSSSHNSRFISNNTHIGTFDRPEYTTILDAATIPAIASKMCARMNHLASRDMRGSMRHHSIFHPDHQDRFYPQQTVTIVAWLSSKMTYSRQSCAPAQRCAEVPSIDLELGLSAERISHHHELGCSSAPEYGNSRGTIDAFGDPRAFQREIRAHGNRSRARMPDPSAPVSP